MVRHYIINMEVQGSNLALCMYYIFFIFSSFLQICLLHPVRLSPAFFIRFFLAVLLLAGLPFPSYRYAVFLRASMPLCPVLAESPCPIRRDQNATFHVVCKLHYDNIHHSALLYLVSKHELTGNLARWTFLLQEFKFNILDRLGV